jgi:hypothetical protein
MSKSIADQIVLAAARAGVSNVIVPPAKAGGIPPWRTFRCEVCRVKYERRATTHPSVCWACEGRERRKAEIATMLGGPELYTGDAR